MGFFNFFSGGNDTNTIQEYLDKGAIVLDVRSLAEFKEGHVEGSKLITLNEISSSIKTIKAWNKPVIIVCKSGGRASIALRYLKNADIDAINGGAWQNAVISG
ncbi:MAG: rhodanese-like domain-containing protein [Flavobacteriaceae bacterium]|nr:rhodanese-like domain-containing protein [Flavobacteriaceae bacterium]